MDLSQALIFEIGWFFFAAWISVLVAMLVLAFGGDLLTIWKTSVSPSRND